MLAQLLSQSLQHTNTCYTTTRSTSCLRLLALWLFLFSESALSFCTDLKIEQCLRFGLKWAVNNPRQAHQRQKQVKKVLNLINSSLGKLPWLLQLPMMKTDGVPFLRILRDLRRLMASDIGCKMSECSAVVLKSSVGQVPQPHNLFFLTREHQQFNKASDGGFSYSVRSYLFEGDANIRVRT